ncbi:MULTISPECIES: tRNA pseudouridine(38-40) synthase TruA [Rhodomicrobium]|uniref:tRNA pseudouridine(38-40) synthase TruA n=1 Tax=Rhodomicrobium TaxID=1068 RepID=UPI000B4BC95E|nr:MULTISPECIES: tRNA pseudouridine(38-40) synthase TruA [Rhodomicrobium]
MPRYKLTIEYDGTPFAGWQMQANAPSVQERMRDAIEAFCGESFIPRGAGRTDSGVHALGQVAHIDLAKDWPADTVMKAVNFHLKPAPVAILSCELADAEFDARFSARARHYLYRIVNRRAPLAIDRDHAWRVWPGLDADAMAEAARHLVGRHDFTTFRASECQAKSPVKTLDVLSVERSGEEIAIRASARSFLHHQVRSMVGSLKLVGEGKWPPGEMRAALEARDRTRCGPMAPSSGLYLVRVDY